MLCGNCLSPRDLLRVNERITHDSHIFALFYRTTCNSLYCIFILCIIIIIFCGFWWIFNQLWHHFGKHRNEWLHAYFYNYLITLKGRASRVYCISDPTGLILTALY